MITLDEARTSRMSFSPHRSSPPLLDVKSAELATVAALTALQYPAKQLKVHIESALRAGCSPEEIIEVIVQMALYAGLPAAETAVEVARDVLRKLGLEQGASQ